MVTTGIIASTGHSLAPNNPFYLYASVFYFLAYTYYSHYFLRLDLTIARLNWNLLCSPSYPRPHSATRKTFDLWQSSRLGFLTAKSTDGAHLAGCMLSKGSQCACELNGVVRADAVGCRAEAAVMLSGGSAG